MLMGSSSRIADRTRGAEFANRLPAPDGKVPVPFERLDLCL